MSEAGIRELREERDYWEAEAYRLRNIMKPNNRTICAEYGLTPCQGALFGCFQGGKIVSMEHLQSVVEVQVCGEITNSCLRVHISKLRKKLLPQYRIKNHYGFGYSLETIEKKVENIYVTRETP